jgi:hypothetical protein
MGRLHFQWGKMGRAEDALWGRGNGAMAAEVVNPKPEEGLSTKGHEGARRRKERMISSSLIRVPS